MARRNSRGSVPSTSPTSPAEPAADPSGSGTPTAVPRAPADRVAEPPAAHAEPMLFTADDRKAASPAADWRAILAGRRPAEVLARLVDGDPLGLRHAAFVRAREGGWLVDADRVHLRTIARCAQRGVEYRGHPAFDEWLAEVVDEAILDLLREDAEALAAGLDPSPEEIARLATLARPLGLDVRAARAIGVAFHTLSLEVRVAFRRVAIEGSSLSEAARELGRAAPAVAADVRRAFDCLLAAEDDLTTRSRGTGGSA